MTMWRVFVWPQEKQICVLGRLTSSSRCCLCCIITLQLLAIWICIWSHCDFDHIWINLNVESKTRWVCWLMDEQFGLKMPETVKRDCCDLIKVHSLKWSAANLCEWEAGTVKWLTNMFATILLLITLLIFFIFWCAYCKYGSAVCRFSSVISEAVTCGRSCRPSCVTEEKLTIKPDYNKRSSRIVPLFSSVLISDCRLSIRLPFVYVSLHPSSHTHKHHLLVFPKKRLWMEENNWFMRRFSSTKSTSL